MDNSDQRTAEPSAGGGGGDSSENSGDWKVQFSPDIRRRVINKIIGVIQKQVPSQEGQLEQLRKIALQYEERVYASAKSQSDYMRRITVKMLNIESKSQNNKTDHLTSRSADSGSNSGLDSMHFQGPSQGQSLPVSFPVNQTQLHQQMSPQNIQNEQSLPLSIPFSQPQLHPQMSLQNIQNNLESVGSLCSAGLSSALSHIPGLTRTPALNLSGQQINVHQMSSFSQSAERTSTGWGVASNDFPNYQELMQRRQWHSQLQRQRGLHNNQPQNLRNRQLLQQQQYLLLPTQQQLMSQQPGLPQQKPLLGQLPGSGNREQNQLVGQENRSEPLQNRQQLLGSLSGNSGHQTDQLSIHMLQQCAVLGQQQTSSSSQLQPSSKPPQLSAIQSQSSQFSQQMVLQQKTSQLQQNMQHRSQIAGSFLEQPNLINQQKQLHQSQRFQPETSTSSIDSKAQPREQITEELQDQVYQKIKTMKDLYLHELNDIYQTILTRTQQKPQSLDQMRKLMVYKEMLECSIAFVQIPKNHITLRHKEKLSGYEKYITSWVSSNRRRRPGQNPTQMMQQLQQPQPQITPVQSHESGTNSQLQSLNSQNSIPAGQKNTTNLQQNNRTSLLQNSMSTAATQQSLIHLMQQNSSSGQGNTINSSQQVVGGSLHVNSVSSVHANVDLSSQSGVNVQHPLHQQPVQNESSQNLQYSTLPTDKHNIFNKAGTPLQSATSPLVLSPSTPMDPSPTPGDSDKHIPAVPMHSNAGNLGSPLSSIVATAPQSNAIGNPGISDSPMLDNFTNHDENHGKASAAAYGHSSEQPIERLMRVVKSVTAEELCAAAAEIASVVATVDRNAGSAPGNGSKAAVGEDLVAMINSCLQARNCLTQDRIPGAGKMRRFFSATPYVASCDSLHDRFKRLEPCDLEASPTSRAKRPKIMDNYALQKEIKHINQRLIDTSISVSDEDKVNSGTIVKCSYKAVTLGPHLKSHYFMHLSPIQPLRLFVPSDYPNSSPQFLDNIPIEVRNDCEDLSSKAKSMLGMSMRGLGKPWSLWEIVKTWDSCTRGVMSEYAQKRGGGSFSSRYGTWEKCQ